MFLWRVAPLRVLLMSQKNAVALEISGHTWSVVGRRVESFTHSRHKLIRELDDFLRRTSVCFDELLFPTNHYFEDVTQDEIWWHVISRNIHLELVFWKIYRKRGLLTGLSRSGILNYELKVFLSNQANRKWEFMYDYPYSRLSSKYLRSIGKWSPFSISATSFSPSAEPSRRSTSKELSTSSLSSHPKASRIIKQFVGTSHFSTKEMCLHAREVSLQVWSLWIIDMMKSHHFIISWASFARSAQQTHLTAMSDWRRANSACEDLLLASLKDNEMGTFGFRGDLEKVSNYLGHFQMA